MNAASSVLAALRCSQRILRIGLRLVALLFLLLIVYIGFNTPLTPSVKKLSPQERQTYTTYLETHLSEPQQFIAEKFDRYDVVLLGEMHWKKQDVDFVRQLIPYLYRTKHVTVFAWEFGASDLQSEADALVNAPIFDRKRAIAFMRRSLFSWDFEEYLQIVQTIWEVNHSTLDGQPKIRFLQLGSDYNPRKLYSSDPAVRGQEAMRYSYDQKMGRIVERQVLQKHAKALWYSGLHHAFTRYRQPLAFFLKMGGMRGGSYLYQRYPERIYLAQLSMPFFDRLLLARLSVPAAFGHRVAYVPPFRGIFDQVYREYRKPFAVDANSIFGDVRDRHSYYSIDRWNGLSLRDMSDGYIVLCATDEIQPVSLIHDWVTSDAELNEVRSLLPEDVAARVRSIPELLKYIATDTQRDQVSDIGTIGVVVSTAR